MRKIIRQTQIKEHSTQYLTIALKMIKIIKTMKFLRSYHTPEEPKETIKYSILNGIMEQKMGINEKLMKFE